MDNIEIKQITELDEDNLNIITTWMYNWWGIEEGYTWDGMKCFVEHSLQQDRLPMTYGAFYNNKIIAIFQFTYEDLGVRPDIYPWFTNFYVDKEYRNKGIGRLLLENIKEIAKKVVPFNELYLYTEHIGLYEKFGWEYISEIDAHIKLPRIQRLYKLELGK